MRHARILKRRFGVGAFRSGRVGGRSSWQIGLLVVFCMVGLISLGVMLYKIAHAKIRSWRDILFYSAYMLTMTFILIIPAIVLLSLDTSGDVGILAIVTLCCLVIPLFLWILIALRKSRHFHHRRKHETEKIDTSAEAVYTAKGNEVDGRPFPSYNFLPQASTATPVSVAPQKQTSLQS